MSRLECIVGKMNNYCEEGREKFLLSKDHNILFVQQFIVDPLDHKKFRCFFLKVSDQNILKSFYVLLAFMFIFRYICNSAPLFKFP